MPSDSAGGGRLHVEIQQMTKEKCPNMARFLSRTMMIVLVVLTATACSRFRGGNEPEIVEADSLGAEQSLAALEAELRQLAASEFEEEAREGQNEQGALVTERPYHYKAYSVFPEGTDAFEIDLRQQESRTAPYSANVTTPKVHFATRLHRNRDTARADENYLRSTGSETTTYELRNQRWVRVGSLFVADKTEEYVDGEWGPVAPRAPETLATDEPRQGWFGRTFGRLLFWR